VIAGPKPEKNKVRQQDARGRMRHITELEAGAEELIDAVLRDSAAGL
jgi:hypothetical protein